MKKLSILIVFLALIKLSSAQEKYRIQVKIDGLKDTTAFMSYYYGKGQYYKDTANVDSKGMMVFSKKDTLEEGMYSVLVGGSKVFDFIVDQQDLSFSTSFDEPIQDMKPKGGSENAIFFEYLKFLNVRQKEANVQRKIQKENPKNSEAYNKAQEEIDKLDTEVRDFLSGFFKKHEGSFTVTFLKALQPPAVPEPPLLENGEKDSLFAFRYFRDHFFDNFDFSDERLLRTAVFNEKVNYYMDKLKSQDPDSIIKSCDFILSKVKDNPELYKYTLSSFTSKYQQSKMMGMDAVFVHLANNYYLNGKAPWMNKTQLAKIRGRAEALEPLLIGKKAPNIIVRDTAQKEILQLYDVKAKYTIVYIWSPECGHCKVATPELKKLYDKVKDKGVEVFGVGNEFENEAWIDFINKYNLNWINGSDGGDFRSNFRDTYDVYSTPQTYLLDENKVILSKKMNVESLEDILEYFFMIEKNQNLEK